METKFKVQLMVHYHGPLWPNGMAGDVKEFTPAQFDQLVADRGAMAFRILPPEPKPTPEPEPEPEKEPAKKQVRYAAKKGN